jgi:hypothetical protein
MNYPAASLRLKLKIIAWPRQRGITKNLDRGRRKPSISSKYDSLIPLSGIRPVPPHAGLNRVGGFFRRSAVPPGFRTLRIPRDPLNSMESPDPFKKNTGRASFCLQKGGTRVTFITLSARGRKNTPRRDGINGRSAMARSGRRETDHSWRIGLDPWPRNPRGIK